MIGIHIYTFSRYCDEDSENPKEFVKFSFVCDGFIDCQDSKADELPSKCSNKCKPVCNI